MIYFIKLKKQEVSKLKILKQILIIFSICSAGMLLNRFIAFPATILSLIVLLILLICGIIKTHHIKETADFVLSNMAFFFIPAGVKIMDSFSDFAESLLPILLVILITTVLTFGATALTVTGLMKVMGNHTKEEN